MASTRATLRSRVYTMLGRASESAAGTYDTEINEALNEAQRRMAGLHRWKTLECTATTSTVAAQKTYAFDSTFMTLHTVLLIDGTNSRELMQLHAVDFDRHYPRPESDANMRPEFFCRRDHWLELYPIPNAVYTLKVAFWKWPTDMTNDALTTEFGEYEEVLKAATCVEMAVILGDDAAIKRFEDRFNRLLLEAIDRDDAEPSMTYIARGFRMGDRTPLYRLDD